MANDIHLKVGQPPKLRIFGELKNTTGEILTAERMQELVFEIMTPAQQEFFLANGTLDFAHEVGREHRFRLNVFRQRGVISLVGRRVSAHVPSFEKLNLPPILAKIAESRQGLVLVVGATGCGKTTTIAAMLDYITKTRSCHIVTVEDPIEYLYNDNKAIVSQREIGIDVANYEDALTYLMRQDPDVVFVGEMRDSKTVTAGMRAAETGHMVMGTMHSSNASQAVHRLLDLFPTNERELVRQALATSIRAIVSQVLLPSIREGIRPHPGGGGPAGHVARAEADQRGTRGRSAQRDPGLPAGRHAGPDGEPVQAGAGRLDRSEGRLQICSQRGRTEDGPQGHPDDRRGHSLILGKVEF